LPSIKLWRISAGTSPAEGRFPISNHNARITLQSIALAIGACGIAYAAYTTAAWYRFGHVYPQGRTDAIADRFMPAYDVREEHHVRVNAPALLTMQSARSMSLNDSALVRAIFKGRELLLRAAPDTASQPHAFVALAQSLGWRILEEAPGREMVFGAVTQPWKPNVVFRGVLPSRFAAFNEPDYVKILWTLRADPIDESHCTFSTETRAVSTDRGSREKFRRYWTTFSPGIVLIRVATLPLVKRDAERRAAMRLR